LTREARVHACVYGSRENQQKRILYGLTLECKKIILIGKKWKNIEKPCDRHFSVTPSIMYAPHSKEVFS